MTKFYAVRTGRAPGVYASWPEAQKQVHGFTGAVFKSFGSKLEAVAFLSGPPPAWVGAGGSGGAAGGGGDAGGAAGGSGAGPAAQKRKRPASELLSDRDPAAPLAAPAGAAGELVLTFDGGARGNPGPAGSGARVVSADAAVLFEGYYWLGHATNNVAEYTALIEGLRAVQRAGLLAASAAAPSRPPRRLVCMGDSKLVILQVLGQWRVNHEGLIPLHAAATELVRQLGGPARVRFEHIPRVRNAAADALANRAMDQRESGARYSRAAEALAPSASFRASDDFQSVPAPQRGGGPAAAAATAAAQRWGKFAFTAEPRLPEGGTGSGESRAVPVAERRPPGAARAAAEPAAPRPAPGEPPAASGVSPYFAGLPSSQWDAGAAAGAGIGKRADVIVLDNSDSEGGEEEAADDARGAKHGRW